MVVKKVYKLLKREIKDWPLFYAPTKTFSISRENYTYL